MLGNAVENLYPSRSSKKHDDIALKFEDVTFSKNLFDLILKFKRRNFRCIWTSWFWVGGFRKKNIWCFLKNGKR